jgi:hypothetical protein
MEQKAEGKICPECQKPGKFFTQINKYRRLDGSVNIYPYTYPFCNKCRYKKQIEGESLND